MAAGIPDRDSTADAVLGNVQAMSLRVNRCSRSPRLRQHRGPHPRPRQATLVPSALSAAGDRRTSGSCRHHAERSAGLTAAAITWIRTSPSAGMPSPAGCASRQATISGATDRVAIARIVVMIPTVGSIRPLVVDRDQSPPDPAEGFRRDPDVRRDVALREPGGEVLVAGQEQPVPLGRVGEQQFGLPLLDAQVERLGQPGRRAAASPCSPRPSRRTPTAERPSDRRARAPRSSPGRGVLPGAATAL